MLELEHYLSKSPTSDRWVSCCCMGSWVWLDPDKPGLSQVDDRSRPLTTDCSGGNVVGCGSATDYSKFYQQ